MTAGLYAHHAGTGPIGSIGVGIVTAAFVLVIGQEIFSFVRTPILRIAVALIFAIPAALAGYYATFGLSELTMTSDLWRQAFAVIGAVCDRGDGLDAACGSPACYASWVRTTGIVEARRRDADGTVAAPLHVCQVLIGARSGSDSQT